jgi:hypothetical protein
MAAANASARGQRAAILASPLHELTGFYLAVDCLAPRCNGERTFAVAELATFYGRDSTVGQVLRWMRCSGACGGRVGAAWLVTGPILSVRVRPRRVALLGPEAREWRCSQSVTYSAASYSARELNRLHQHNGGPTDQDGNRDIPGIAARRWLLQCRDDNSRRSVQDDPRLQQRTRSRSMDCADTTAASTG